METFIKYGLITFIVSLTIYFLNRGSKENSPQNVKGEFLLKMNKLYLFVGYLSWTIALIVLIALFNSSIQISAVIPIMFLSLLFGGLGTPCVLYGKNHYVKFDEREIEVRNIYNKINSVIWTEIASIKFNATLGLITIKDNKGTKIIIHQHLVGLSSFINTLETKTNWRALDLGLPK